MTQFLTTSPAGDTAEVSAPLQATLVELIDLQAKQAHWNIVGPGFGGIHIFLDQLTDQFRDWYDEVAERLAAIGVSPDGRATTVASSSPLEPLPAGQIRDQEVLALFDARLKLVADRVRARLDPIGAHDLVSQDLLVGIVQGLEKQDWMLRALRA
jgi:starvation-inducible DNA-binding protein